jgi:hypothetical protein
LLHVRRAVLKGSRVEMLAAVANIRLGVAQILLARGIVRPIMLRSAYVLHDHLRHALPTLAP